LIGTRRDVPHDSEVRFRLRKDRSFRLFLSRTVSAQIHGLGFVLMIAGAFVLLPLANRAGSAHLWACVSFVISGAIVFLVSSVYHFLNDGCVLSRRLTNLFEYIDHFGIYLFIAGTYSPILMSTVTKPWLSVLLIAIWIIALLGIIYTGVKQKLPRILQSRAVYTSLFVIMGWTLIVRGGEVLTHISRLELALLISGAIAYMVGALIYATRRPRLVLPGFGYHELWHVMVLVGASLHFCTIFVFYYERVG
jgi:hemolysin III